jgi:hypothetical protein
VEEREASPATPAAIRGGVATKYIMFLPNGSPVS